MSKVVDRVWHASLVFGYARSQSTQVNSATVRITPFAILQMALACSVCPLTPPTRLDSLPIFAATIYVCLFYFIFLYAGLI